MTTLLPTPPAPVRDDGTVAAFGLFTEPFRSVNLTRTRIWPALGRLAETLAPWRLKQWQHIAVITPRYLLAAAVVDAHYLGSSFCYVLDRQTGVMVEHHGQAPGGRAAEVATVIYRGACRFAHGGYRVEIANRLDEGWHRLDIDIAGDSQGPAVRASVRFEEDLKRVQPLVCLLPIAANRPLYTHKAPCPAQGYIEVDGRRQDFGQESSATALLDEQKTFYPYQTFWRWCTAAGHDAEGHAVAFNLVQNMIADDDRYNENVVWVDGAMSRFGGARFTFDEKNPLAPWDIRTTDDRCRLTFHPVGKRSERMDFGVVLSDYHQPYGAVEGVVVDDAGASHTLSLYGVTEAHRARF